MLIFFQGFHKIVWNIPLSGCKSLNCLSWESQLAVIQLPVITKIVDLLQHEMENNFMQIIVIKAMLERSCFQKRRCLLQVMNHINSVQFLLIYH